VSHFGFEHRISKSDQYDTTDVNFLL